MSSVHRAVIRRVDFLHFTKVEHTLFSVPLLFAGAFLGAGRKLPPGRVLGLIVVAGLGARVLGMAMNRIFDRRLDALNLRTANRELPSGKMSLGAAIAVGGRWVRIIPAGLLGARPSVFDARCGPGYSVDRILALETLHEPVPFRHRTMPGPGAAGRLCCRVRRRCLR